MDFSFLISQVDSAVINMKVAGDLILAGSDTSALLAELEAAKTDRDNALAQVATLTDEVTQAQVQIDVLTAALEAANATIMTVLPAAPVV